MDEFHDLLLRGLRFLFRHAGKVQDCPYCEQAHIRLVSRDEMEQFRKLVGKNDKKESDCL